MIEFKEYEESITKESGPDLTPLIDMVFLLLIFFLLTSFLARPSVPVTLPETETAEVHADSYISVVVRKDGQILFNGDPVSEARLLRSLMRSYEMGEKREVVIMADREVPFGRVVEVMDVSKKAGTDRISFLVEYKR
ncbi:MAG: ExbD/TolR family protein [Spirochaetota bacterium]